MVDQQNNFTEKIPDIIRRNAFKPVPTSENGFFVADGGTK
jgi:hypothetical protein